MSCFRLSPSRPANNPINHPPRARELLLLPFLAALGILAAAKAVVSFFPSSSGGGLRSTGQVTPAAPPPPAAAAADLNARQAGLDIRYYSGLIDPHNGDNGTDPAQTTTAECTGDFTLPVLDGVDLVSYFSLSEGDSPVYGTDNYMAVFGAYRFYFSSIQNLRVFEEAPERYLPAWGGFCSYGVANEVVWTGTTLGPFGDPSKWAIFPDNRLHIFRSAVPLQKFQDDVSGNIKRGNDVWFRWFGVEGAPLNTACICAETICDDQ